MSLHFKDGRSYPHLTQNFDFVLKTPFRIQPAEAVLMM